MEDILKSIRAALYNRAVSPLYGTLVLSWCVWNWKIIYVTLFISEDKLNSQKIEFITSNYLNPFDLYLYPIITSLILITVVPAIDVLAYRVSRKYNRMKLNIKIKMDGNDPIPPKTALSLRNKIAELETSSSTLLEEKNQHIESLITDNKKLTDEILKLKNNAKQTKGSVIPTITKKDKPFKNISDHQSIVIEKICAGQKIDFNTALGLLDQHKLELISVYKKSQDYYSQVSHRSEFGDGSLQFPIGKYSPEFLKGMEKIKAITVNDYSKFHLNYAGYIFAKTLIENS